MNEDAELKELIEGRSVACALPDLGYALALVLGVFVVGAALALAVLKQIKDRGL